MGPSDNRHAPSGIHAPLPEDAAIRAIAAYTETYGLVIKAARGMWTVEDGDADPVEIESYTDLMVFLARRYGSPGR